MAITINQIISNIKNMDHFYVQYEMDPDEPLQFRGQVPFDMMIEGNMVACKVLAYSQEDAEQRVASYFNSLNS